MGMLYEEVIYQASLSDSKLQARTFAEDLQTIYKEKLLIIRVKKWFVGDKDTCNRML